VLSFFRVAKRVTFVVDKQGIIRHIDRGAAAADPGSALEAAGALG
jgi:peroxiredoxin